MHFVNLITDGKLSRDSFEDVNYVVADPSIAPTDEVDIWIEGVGLKIEKKGSKPSSLLPFAENFLKMDAKGMFNALAESENGSLFEYDPLEEESDPLIWVATKSILMPQDISVTLGYLPLDDGDMLVCLKKGIIRVQDAEGNYIPLSRGEVKLPRGIDDVENVQFYACTSTEFFGLPVSEEYYNSLMNFTIQCGVKTTTGKSQAKMTYESHNTSFSPVKDFCAILDAGYRYEIQEELKAEEARKAEELRIIQEEAKAKARLKADMEAAAEPKKSTRTRKASTTVKKDNIGKGERNSAAASFLASVVSSAH